MPAEGGGNLFTTKEYANFVLRLEWRLWEGSNNGVGIRAPLEGDAAYVGMEIQVLDDDAEVYEKMHLKPTQYTGSVYDVFAARRGFVRRNGEWNSEEIVADGRHIRVTLNGQLITDVNLDDVRDEAVLKRHPGLQRKTGHIGFLGPRNESGIPQYPGTRIALNRNRRRRGRATMAPRAADSKGLPASRQAMAQNRAVGNFSLIR